MDDLISIISMKTVIGIIGFITGAIFGHWLAKRRTMRADLLIRTVPLARLLVTQKSSQIIETAISADDLDWIEWYYTRRGWIDCIRGRGYRAAADEYLRSQKECLKHWKSRDGFFSMNTELTDVPDEVLTAYFTAIKRFMKYLPIH